MHKNILLQLLSTFVVSEQVQTVEQSFDIFDPFGKIFDPVDWVMDFNYEKIVPILQGHEGKMTKSFWKIEEDLGCASCKVGVWTVQLFNNKVFKWTSTQNLNIICWSVLWIPFIPVSPYMCSGLINDFWTEQIFEVLFDQLITEQTMCTFILELCDMDKWQAIDLDQWVFDKINEKPKIAQSNDYINKLYVSQKKKPLKVALFTDIHLDYDYLVGAKNAKCGRIICCRADSGEAENDEEKAGFWGS